MGWRESMRELVRIHGLCPVISFRVSSARELAKLVDDFRKTVSLRACIGRFSRTMLRVNSESGC